MKKYYLDVEAKYLGELPPDFSDHKNWKVEMIGILQLNIMEGKVISKQFNQYAAEVSPINLHEGFNQLIQIFENLSDDNILVTWNGRSFDLPVIFQNLLQLPILIPQINNMDYLKYLARKCVEHNRDLIDIALLKQYNIKGGLLYFVKMMRAKNKIPIPEIDIPEIGDIDMQKSAAKEFVSLDHHGEYQDVHEIVKHKNEIDTKVLPEIEHYMGMLHEPLNELDKIRHRWKYNRPIHHKLIMNQGQVLCA